MSSPTDSQLLRQQLLEDIDLYQTLLNSLEDEKDSEEERQHYLDKLATLKQELNGVMGSVSSRIGEPELDQDLTTSNHIDRSGGDGSVQDPSKPPQINLPSRKRDRSAFDDDEPSHEPLQKSLRPTPTHSPTLSATDSIGSDFFNDLDIGNVLGDGWRDSQKKYLSELEEKKRQQEEDEQLARRLQEEWSRQAEPVSATQPSRPSIASLPMSQSFLRADGTYQPPSSQTPNSRQDDSSGGRSSPAVISLNSSDDDLTVLSGNDWRNSFPFQPVAPPRTLPPSFGSSFNVPGAFPGGQVPSFASRPGVPVYGGSNSHNPYNFSKSSLGPANGLYGINGSSSPWDRGTTSNPFDLDSLNMPPLPHGWMNDVYSDPKETQEQIKQLLTHVRPDEQLTLTEIDQIQPEGLKEKLMPHQLRGVAWMKKMEAGSNKGGILADDMGLGKTIQAIALMLERPPERSRRPTLVVAPVALMEQWKREMEKMVKRKHRFTVVTLHGTQARKSFADIANCDIVMTTYGTLASELKRQLKWEEKVRLVPEAKRSKAEECPMLSEESRFHRIILDEAQCIKNQHTWSAKSACRVKAEYRWCLSGTPMQNSVEEIYSLIKFCRIQPYNNADKFNRDIGRPLKSKWESGKEKAMQQLQVLLKAVLLRRTKKSEIDGKPIIQLPEKHTVENRAIFNKDELDFYKALETQARIEFNRYLKKGTVGQNHARALVLLLRLRQCCCSPQLVTNASDFVADIGVEGADLEENARQLSRDVVERLKQQTDIECPICMDAADNPVILGTCGHMLCRDCLSKMFDNVMQESGDVVKCPHCREKIEQGKVTDFETFQKIHISDTRTGIEDDEETASEDSDDDSDDDEDEGESDDVESDGDDDPEEVEDLKDFVVPDNEEFIEYNDDDDNDDDADDDSYEQKIAKFIPKNESDSDDNKTETKKLVHVKVDKKTESEDEDGLPDLASTERKPSKKIFDVTNSNDSVKNGKKLASKSVQKGKTKSKKSKHSKKSKGKRKAKDNFTSLADLRKQGLRSQAAKRKYIRQLGKGYEPSAKIEKTLSLLQEIKDRGEGEKTIIFSSFTSFLDLLEVPLSRDDELNNYTRYDGSMTAKDRNQSVLRFTDDPHCTIILVSIKAGNSGLNLTAANHVIILDPFWNPYVEYQAADRCYRIGQRREVTIHRVLIGEEGRDHTADPDYQFTVEDRILQLQEKKRRLVESALDENSTSAIARLGTRELGYLFGVNDMEGRAIEH